ncbi:MAG: hypothetical protein M1831_006341 [Alyxoria varia]|nr:MAG: hypothetical protein M1831_006341 [Alyxoria varia]
METCDIDQIKKDRFGCPWDLFYFSRDGGKRAPRPYVPGKHPPCILRSHPVQDRQILIEHLRKTWPHVTHGIFPPRNFQTLWDAFDIGVMGEGFLRETVEQIGKENQQILAQFMVKWLSDQKDNYDTLSPDRLDIDHAFHPKDHGRFGRLFLEHALFWIQVRYHEAQQLAFQNHEFEKSANAQRAPSAALLRASDPGPPVNPPTAPVHGHSKSMSWPNPGQPHFAGASQIGNPQYRMPPAQYGPAVGAPGSSVPYPHMPIPYVTGTLPGPHGGNFMPWVNAGPPPVQMQTLYGQPPPNFPPSPFENPELFSEYSNGAHGMEAGQPRRHSGSHRRGTHSHSGSQQSPGGQVEASPAIHNSQNANNRGGHNASKRGGRRKSTIDRAFEFQRNLPAPSEHAEIEQRHPHAAPHAYRPSPSNNMLQHSFENRSSGAQVDRPSRDVIPFNKYTGSSIGTNQQLNLNQAFGPSSDGHPGNQGTDSRAPPDWSFEVGPRFIGQKRNDITRLFVKYPRQAGSAGDIEKAFKQLPSVINVERKTYPDKPMAIFVHLKSTDDCRKLLLDRGINSSDGQFCEVIVPRMYYTPYFTQNDTRSPQHARFNQGGNMNLDSDRRFVPQDARAADRGFDPSHAWRDKNDAKTEEEHRIRKNSSAGVYTSQDARSSAGQDIDSSTVAVDIKSLTAPVINLPKTSSGLGTSDALPSAKPPGREKADQKPKKVAESSKTDSRQEKNTDTAKETASTGKHSLGAPDPGTGVKPTKKGPKSGRSKEKGEPKPDLRKQTVAQANNAAEIVNTEPPKNINKKRKTTKNGPHDTSPTSETTEHQATAEHVISRPEHNKSGMEVHSASSQSDNRKGDIESTAKLEANDKGRGGPLLDSAEERKSISVEATSSPPAENQDNHVLNSLLQEEVRSTDSSVTPSQYDTQGQELGNQELKKDEDIVKDHSSIAEISDTMATQVEDDMNDKDPMLESSLHHTAEEAVTKPLTSASTAGNDKSQPASKQKLPGKKIVPALPNVHTRANKKNPSSKVGEKTSSSKASPNLMGESPLADSTQERGIVKDVESVPENKTDTPSNGAANDTSAESGVSRKHPATQAASEQSDLGTMPPAAVHGLDGSSSNHEDQHGGSKVSIPKPSTGESTERDKPPPEETLGDYGSDSVSIATQEEVTAKSGPETPEKGMTAPLSAISSAAAPSTEPDTPSSAISSKDPIDQSIELSSTDQKMVDQVKIRLDVGKTEYNRIESFISRSDTIETRKNQWKTQLEDLEQQLYPLCEKILENENSRIRQQGNMTRRKKTRNKLRDDWKTFDSCVEDLRMFQGRLEREEKEGQKTTYSNTNGGENNSHVMDEEAQRQYNLLSRKLSAKMPDKHGNADRGLSFIFFKTDEDAPSESSRQHSNIPSHSTDVKARLDDQQWRDVHSDGEETIQIMDNVESGEAKTPRHITEPKAWYNELELEQGPSSQKQGIESAHHHELERMKSTDTSEPTLTAAEDERSPASMEAYQLPDKIAITSTRSSGDEEKISTPQQSDENAYTSSDSSEPTVTSEVVVAPSSHRDSSTRSKGDEDAIPNLKPTQNLASLTEGSVTSRREEATISVTEDVSQPQTQEHDERPSAQVSQHRSSSSKEEKVLAKAAVAAQNSQAEAVTSTPSRPALKNWAQIARGNDEQTPSAGEINSQTTVDDLDSPTKSNTRSDSVSSNLGNAGPLAPVPITPNLNHPTLTPPRGRSVPGSSPPRRMSPSKLGLPSQASGGGGGRRESFPRAGAAAGDEIRKPSDDWKVGPSGTWPKGSLPEGEQERTGREDDQPTGSKESDRPADGQSTEQESTAKENTRPTTGEENILAILSTANEQETTGKESAQATAGKEIHPENVRKENELGKAAAGKRGKKGKNKKRTGNKGSGSSRASLT